MYSLGNQSKDIKMNKKVVIFLTNYATLGETNEKNGTYISELTHALDEMIKAGFDYDLVSINGGKAPIYGEDALEEDEISRTLLDNKEFSSRLNNTMKVSDIKASDYDGVYYPGGFGLLTDLAVNEEVAEISRDIYEAGKPVAAVCHGPAGFLPIKLSNGKSILEGKSVTSFTREEEIAFGTIDKIPYLLEESLMGKAHKFSKVQPWQEHVIVDGLLISGQNPGSAAAVGKEMVKKLQA